MSLAIITLQPHKAMIPNIYRTSSTSGTVHVWMNILRREPRAFLWLLEPVREDAVKIGDNPDEPDTNQQGMFAKEHLLQAAISAGLAPSRLIYAPRVDKQQHMYVYW